MLTEKKEYHWIFPFGEGTARATAVKLLDAHLPGRGLIVDLGAGNGSIGRPLQDLGFAYHAVEAHSGALPLLEAEGLAYSQADLTDLTSLEARLEELEGVAGLCLLDVLEHLVEPETLLLFLSRYALANFGQAQPPLLVISVPNVTHQDLGLKLLMGRWQLKAHGLLDADHVRFFTNGHLRSLLQRCGWELVERHDRVLTQSDQHDPALLGQLPTPALKLLQEVAAQAHPYGEVNQFVWILRPVAVETPPLNFFEAVDDGGESLPLPQFNLMSSRVQAVREELIETELARLQAHNQDLQLRLRAGQQEKRELDELKNKYTRLEEEYTRLQAWSAELQANLARLENWANELQARLGHKSAGQVLQQVSHRLAGRLRPRK